MPNATQLTIISTCTNQKRGKIPSEYRLRNFAGRFSRDAAKAWVSRLQESSATHPARDLYLGSHWQETIACVDSAAELGFQTDLWVLSAGFGLINANELLVPYSASFSSGPDSIQNLSWQKNISPRAKAQEWWTLLHRNSGRKSLRRFAHGRRSNHLILMILSREYYYAVEPEIIDLISAGNTVFIVSAGLYGTLNTAAPIVRPNVLPFNDGYKQIEEYLNKTNTSLNARLATWLVRNHGHELPKGINEVANLLSEIEKQLPPMKRKDLNRMTDEEVLAYIEENHSRAFNSATKLLRKLRDIDNLSCEQKRFGSLFRKYMRSDQEDLFDHE